MTSTTPMTSTMPTTTDDPTGGEETTAEDTTGGAPMVSYTADIQPIWDAKCTVGCHTSTGSASATGVFLDPPNSYATTVGKTSVSVPSLMVVAAGDSAGSYLWHKLDGTYMDVGGTGSPMPIGTPLTADELELIKLWIDGGALP
jgi:hypothetical protein